MTFYWLEYLIMLGQSQYSVGQIVFYDHETAITEHFTDFQQSYASVMSVIAFSGHFSFDIMKVFQFNNNNFNICTIDNKHVAQSVL